MVAAHDFNDADVALSAEADEIHLLQQLGLMMLQLAHHPGCKSSGPSPRAPDTPTEAKEEKEGQRGERGFSRTKMTHALLLAALLAVALAAPLRKTA